MNSRYLTHCGQLAAAVGLITIVSSISAPGALGQGGPGADPARRAIIRSLSDEERQKFFAMSPEEKQKFMAAKLKQKGGSQAKGGPAKGGKPGARRGRRPPPLVVLANVVKEPLRQIFPITGRLVSGQRSDVAARIKGSIANVLVKVGDRVKTGQVIAELKVDRLKLEADLRAADVIMARAKWNSAKASVDLLKQELKRLERLRKSAAFSQARHDDKRQQIVKSQANVDDTAAALRRARSSRDLARIDVKDATIRAPYDGVVLVKHVSPGVYINPGTRIVSLLDDENMEIEADVPSVRLEGVRPGAVVTVRLDDNNTMAATVRAVIPDENPLARTRAVRLTPDIGTLKNKLVVNQSVIIEVPQGGSRDVVAVPKDAIVNRQSGKIVFVFEKGRVRQANVQIGESFAGKFEVISGLQPGQKVVVKGNETLRAGQPVRLRGGKPGGPRGGKRGAPTASGAPAPGTNGSAPGGLTRDQRRAIVRGLSDEERQKFFGMSPEEKQKFFKDRAKKSGGAA